jgi:hypothetical protein
MGAAIVERDVGANDQITHGPGREDLTGCCGRHHPGSDVDTNATDIAVAQLDLTGV